MCPSGSHQGKRALNCAKEDTGYYRFEYLEVQLGKEIPVAWMPWGSAVTGGKFTLDKGQTFLMQPKHPSGGFCR